MKDSAAIRVQNIQKRYGDLLAVKGLDFSIARGEIFSLLGPNGAGKSTTISMLSTLLPPSHGDAWVMGHSIVNDQQAAKRILGVVPQEIALYEDLSARQNLLFWGRMYGLSGARLKQRVTNTLEMVGLSDRQNDLAGRFSGGMQRRLNIAAALLHEPQVVIMDEPTVGIDPQSRRRILDGVKELNACGVSILYTTHYMEEAQELSHRIAIMDHGQIIALGTYAELTRLIGESHCIALTLEHCTEELMNAWRGLPAFVSLSLSAGQENGPSQVSLLVHDSSQALTGVVEAAARLGEQILSIHILEPDLEAVFLHLTGKALRN